MSNSNELYHYGDLGMKWGVRRGKYAQSYSKGVEKLKKMDKKSAEWETSSKHRYYQASKLRNKAARSFSPKKRQRLLDKAMSWEARGAKLEYSASKYRRKGEKFYKKMEKIFADVDVNQLNRDDVEYGKRYADRILH